MTDDFPFDKIDRTVHIGRSVYVRKGMSYTKSEETRGRLMQAMSHLLRTQGFHATGVQQIIKESGIPKGSLYYHFPCGKEELAAEAIEKTADLFTRMLEEIAAAETDPVEMVRIFCDFYIEELRRESFTLGCPIATITLEAAATNDRIHRACKAAFAKLNTPFVGQLINNGVLPEQAADMATIALASIEGAMILCKAERSTAPLALVRDNLLRQVALLLADA